MVRLVDNRSFLNRSFQEFQFHYGTIGRYRNSILNLVKSDFNSTMVRLVVRCQISWNCSNLISIPLWYDWSCISADHARACWMNFNSTMVRLVVLQLELHLQENLNFNSTMVRLVVGFRVSMKSLISFQFHYGTIGRRYWRLPAFLTTISIPLWYDW